MREREQEAWERFCQTGAVGDYLDYRASVGFTAKQPMDTRTEVEPGAAINRCGSGAGKASGGAGSAPDAADP